MGGDAAALVLDSSRRISLGCTGFSFVATKSSSLVVVHDLDFKYSRACPQLDRHSPPPPLVSRVHPDPAEGGLMMRMKMFAGFATTLLFAALALNISAAAADQHSGTWKMNPAKSTYSPGPAPRSGLVKIDSDAENIKLNSDGIDAAGNPTHVEYTAKYDGKDYPINGLPNADTVALERPDASTIRSTLKKGDQVVMTVTSVISKDGKMRTSTFKGKDAQGQEVTNVVVYDKL
jgi:hypothetical protein